jgi:hypothetical protein
LVGYNDLFHLAPAILGGLMFLVGLALTYREMMAATYESSEG